ncbi:hypothetical protein JNW88_27390 [Micromonospora sp. ATA32]|nr:hypothetical protein [Micromonospora sp. ATA32]
MSPTMSIRSVHSRRTVPTQRSAKAFALGGADALRAIREAWGDDQGPMGTSLLLAHFGTDFLLPELVRHQHATNVVRKIYQAAERFLADEEMLIRDAAFFGLIEPLGLAVHFLSPEDVGPLVAKRINTTYPAWPGVPRCR